MSNHSLAAFLTSNTYSFPLALTLPARDALNRSDSSATGIAGVLGNKGGLVVKLNVDATSLVFISAHLAAHSCHLDKVIAECLDYRK